MGRLPSFDFSCERSRHDPVKPVMLVAGDNAGKKPVMTELIGRLGFEERAAAGAHARSMYGPTLRRFQF